MRGSWPARRLDPPGRRQNRSNAASYTGRSSRRRTKMVQPATRTSRRSSIPIRASVLRKAAVCPGSTSRPARRKRRPNSMTFAAITPPSTSRMCPNRTEICRQSSPAMKRFECRAILFDLDGVLVDSTTYIEEQWRRWATAKGLAPEPFLRFCHGRRALETIRLAAPHLDAEAEVAAFVPDDAGNGNALKPVEGASRLLQTLPVGSWAVATSGTRTAATERLTDAGLPIPGVLVCAEDVVHGKPSPDVYLLAAAGLGVSPADCIVV